MLPYFRKSEGLGPSATVVIDAPAHGGAGPLRQHSSARGSVSDCTQGLGRPSWGADTVFCDPWAWRCYFASELAEESRLIARVTGGFTDLTIDASLPDAGSWNAAWTTEIGITL